MKLLKGDDAFFRKDEDGRNLFYPWGYPGEAFLINDKIKSSLVLCGYGLLFSYALIIFFACLFNYYGFISLNALSFAVSAFTSVYFLAYLYLMFYFKKRSQLYALSEGERQRKVKALLFSWVFILVQTDYINSAIEMNIFSSLIGRSFFLFLSACTILMFYVFYLIIKTRGYLFESGTFFSS